MLIKSVRLNNIRSYLNETIEFPTGCIMLSGDIGSGKSTILLAIEFALFGLTSSVDGYALMRNGSNLSEVELRFSTDEKEVIVKRALKRLKDIIRQEPGYIIINGKKHEATPIELKAKILEILGYPKDLLTKSKNIIYRYTVFTPQEEMKLILQDAPSRLDTLRKVFQIDKYKRIRENADLSIKGMKEKSRLLSARSEDLNIIQTRKDEALKELSINEQKARETEPQINATEEQISSKKSGIISLETNFREFSEHRRKMEIAESRINERKKIILQAEKEKEQLKLEMETLKEKKQSSAEIHQRFSTLIYAAKTVAARITEAVAEKTETRQKLTESEEQLSKTTAEIRKNQFVLENSRKTITGVSQLTTCPTCMQPVSQEHKDHILGIEQQKTSESETALNELMNDKNRLQEKIAQLRKKLDEIHEKEKRLANITSEIENYSEIQTSLVTGNDEFTPTHQAELRIAYKQMRDMLNIDEKLEDKQRLANAINEKATIARNEIGELEEEKELEIQKITELSGIEETISNARKELEDLQRHERQLAIQKNTLAAEKNALTKLIQTLEEDIKKKMQAKKEIGTLNSLIHWLDEHLIGLTGTIERQVMLKVYNEFNTYFQNWFNTLIEDQTMNIRLDEEFTPIIEQNGHELPFENMSGGERTSCALAYRLALNKVINGLITTIKTRDLIILDEPTDGFSSEQLERVRDVINQLQIKQIIMVSHETKIESYADKVIRIVKEDSVSRVIA